MRKCHCPNCNEIVPDPHDCPHLKREEPANASDARTSDAADADSKRSPFPVPPVTDVPLADNPPRPKPASDEWKQPGGSVGANPAAG